MLLEGWSYPVSACSRVTIDTLVIESGNFKETEWVQSTDILIDEDEAGSIEMRYLTEKPTLEEGPFSHEERGMLETVAAELGGYMSRKRAEQKLLQQHKELELYSSLLRHDLRNDVGVIIGNCEIFKMMKRDPDSIMKEIISSTEAVCDRMMSLLAAFGRSTKMAQLNLPELITKIANQSQEVNRLMTINIAIDKNASRIRVSESRLLPMVFDNLFRNVALHVGERATVEVAISRDDGNAVVIVSDDGPGVSDEVSGRLFQKGASTKGGGLGLYLSRQILEAMGGSIDLEEPEEGKGATFKMILPTIV
ncbi:MAG: sensor histidine kinase [Candidatus Thorarchaeota archaeon]